MFQSTEIGLVVILSRNFYLDQPSCGKLFLSFVFLKVATLFLFKSNKDGLATSL